MKSSDIRVTDARGTLKFTDPTSGYELSIDNRPERPTKIGVGYRMPDGAYGFVTHRTRSECLAEITAVTAASDVPSLTSDMRILEIGTGLSTLLRDCIVNFPEPPHTPVDILDPVSYTDVVALLRCILEGHSDNESIRKNRETIEKMIETARYYAESASVRQIPTMLDEAVERGDVTSVYDAIIEIQSVTTHCHGTTRQPFNVGARMKGVNCQVRSLLNPAGSNIHLTSFSQEFADRFDSPNSSSELEALYQQWLRQN